MMQCSHRVLCTSHHVCRGEDRYLIRWQSSGREKYVRRFNLIFEGESMEHFKQRISAAVCRREEVGPGPRSLASLQVAQLCSMCSHREAGTQRGCSAW